ncbi:hypothetical protein LTR02_018117 [Friedmanniomyces endolithicus]|nr:hypothetical protein LTR02_018117 [Friedmanniomyces endolithicus]
MQRLWESVSRVPFHVDPEAICYTRSLAYHTAFSEDTLNVVDKSNVTFHRDSITCPELSEVPKAELWRQLWMDIKAQKRCQISALVVKSDDNSIRIPPTPGYVPHFPEVSTQIIVASKDHLTDLHIDNGKDVLSAVVDVCRKIFVLYPPTTKNLRLLDGVENEPFRLATICQKLEGALYSEVTSSKAIVIPAGTLHAVITIVGGTLISKDFYTVGTLAPMSRWIATSKASMNRISLHEQEARRIIDCWITAAHVVLADRTALSIVSALIEASSMIAMLLRRANNRGGLQRSLQKLFKSLSSGIYWAELTPMQKETYVSRVRQCGNDLGLSLE